MGGVMFSGLALNVVDCGFEPQSVQTMTLKFSFKHTAIRRKSKDLLALDQDNVCEWSDISTHVLLVVS
jgi:hypothetical protein